MLLSPVTCEDEHCIPDESAYLEPGELLPPGVDPAPVVNFITNTMKWNSSDWYRQLCQTKWQVPK